MDTPRRHGPVTRATRRLLSMLRGSTHALAEGETRLWSAGRRHADS